MEGRQMQERGEMVSKYDEGRRVWKGRGKQAKGNMVAKVTRGQG